MKILYRLISFILVVSTMSFISGLVVSLLSGSFMAFESYGRAAEHVAFVSFKIIIGIGIALIMLIKLSKGEDASVIKIAPTSKDEWRNLRHHVGVAVLGFIIVVASVVLAKTYLFSHRYRIDLKKGYHLVSVEGLVDLYDSKGSKIATNVYRYREVNDLIIGYAGIWDVSDGDPFGYFVIDTKTGSIWMDDSKDYYLESLQKRGISSEPKLLEPVDDNQK